MTKHDWFVKLLKASDCISVDSGPLLTSWTFNDEATAKDDIQLSLSWVDDDGLQFEEEFTRESIEGLTIEKDTTYSINNSEGEKCSIALYRLSKQAMPGHL